MFHYLVLIWDPYDSTPVDAAAELAHKLESSNLSWDCVYRAEGIALYLQASEDPAVRAYVLPDRSGVVVGRLFPVQMEHWYAGWEVRISSEEARAFAQSGGQTLVDRYWGVYAAFLRDEVSQCHYVVRDCSGMCPCYRTRVAGVDVVFADIRDLKSLEPPRFSINWRYLTAYAASTQLQIRDCGFNEVQEVLAGEGVKFQKNLSTPIVLWDPRHICTREAIKDFDEARKLLYAVTTGCVQAWASIFDRILIRISGGLDSV